LNINIELQPGAKVPTYETDGASGFDFYAHKLCQKGKSHGVTDFAVWSTGVMMEIPEGYSLLLLSRSGHGVFSDIRLANSIGLIDSDYRGEIFVGLRQDSSFCKEAAEDNTSFPARPRLGLDAVKPGDRIAQGIIVQTPRISFIQCSELSPTQRGEKGLGSTNET